MPTPSERLEARQLRQDCRLCTWLTSLPDQERADWRKAVANPRYSSRAIATLACEDQKAAEYTGLSIAENTVRTHRLKGH